MKRRLWIVGTLLAVLALPALATAETIAVATFADGKGDIYSVSGALTTNNSVDTVVDAFTGKAGGGWANGWQWRCGGSSTLTEKVVGMGDGGYVQLVDANYLQYRFSTASSSSRHSCIYRDYSPDVMSDVDHSIEFTVRIMENLASTPGTTGRFRHSQDKYEIHDRQFAGTYYTYTSSECTWGISVAGDNKKWQIKSATYAEDGTPTYISTDTGITISQDTPLSFKLDFDMSAGYNGTFDVTIKSGETPLYSGTGFGLGKAANAGTYSRETTGRLVFDGFANNDIVTGTTREGTNYRSLDIDAIKVIGIPEPGVLTLALGLLLAGSMLRRRS
jgi:hypothetical protein